MKKVQKEIVAMLEKNPAGIPMKKLAVTYSQTYHRNLTLSDLGFDSMVSLVASLKRDLVVEEEVVFSRSHFYRAQQAKAAAEKSKKMVFDEIVVMVKEHPSGIPLKKLAVFYGQRYHKNLTLSDLGVESTVSLVASLDRDLVEEGELVFHKDHRCPTIGVVAGAGPGVTEDKRTETVLDNIVAMMKEHPGGILLKKVALAYSQKYHHNLTVASLGFKTMSCLIESLKGDLVIVGEMVFHKIYQPPSQPVAGMSAKALQGSRPATPQRTESPVTAPGVTMSKADVHSPHVPPPQAANSLLGSPLIVTPTFFTTHHIPVDSVSTVSKPVEMTQEELYQRVLQVLKKYQLSESSMDQLQTCYLKMFGEQLPLKQYMSLYDSWEASAPKTQPIQPEPKADPVIFVSEQAAASHLTREAVKEQQEQDTGVNFLSQSEFPSLGADASTTKTQKSNTVDRPKRESSVPVFREAYHAQLREVHGANMRALEAMEDEDEGAGARRRRFLDQDKINSLMEEVIREIAADGELVTKERAISRVCQLMQIPLSDAGRIKTWFVPALRDLQYIMREINMFIESTEVVTSICTLYELGQSLAGLKDKKSYGELNLGPLCKLPLIHRMFKIDSNTKDEDIHQIETVDILKQLRIFRRKNQGKQKIDLADFMKHLADHYNCESPYELGIRIHSVGLPIATLSKVSRCEHSILEQAREVIQRELEEETQERLRKIKKSVLEQVPGAGSSFSAGNLELRKSYASMTAAEVVMMVFTNAEGVFSPRMAKNIQSFLLQVSDNRLARTLFQLAICGGSLAVPQDLVPKEKASKTNQQAKQEDKPSTSLPSEAKVKQFLKDSLSSQNSTITLAYVAALERKLIKHFQVKDFLSLQQGNFLEFLNKHIQLLQDTVGSTLILSSTELAGSGFKPTRQDVFEFINQCGDITSTDPNELSHIESALRCHYRVRDSRDLGYGTLHMLAGLVKRQRGMPGGGLSQVYYEPAMFVKCGKLSVESGCEAVGRLGEMSKDQALASLLSCPLLEDLSEWSQWELIFKPLHGPLKEFIERNAANTGLAALEVTPGLLLRITTHRGVEQFSSAVTSLDPVATAGHLVSMVVADGIVNAPRALMANHMESSLAAAVAKEDLSKAEEDMSCYSRVAKFILECLTRIPTRICQELLKQVFLEPFSHVLGQVKSKQVLITVAQSDSRHLNVLHRLGILLGITEWVKDYQRKLNPPQSQSYSTTFAAPVEQTKSNLIDSESSSLSALNTSEDEYLEENIMESSFASTHLNNNMHEVNGEVDVEVEEEEDGEELYELTSLPNGETSDMSSDAEEVQGEEPSQVSDSDGQDANSCQTEPPVSLQKALIDEIRKTEFGIGVELNAEGQKLMQVSQERLGRSLDRLSTELYSKDTHFVLELIQNADDNSYPSETGFVPALAFVVEKDCITVLNNEMGFQDKNIRAICDVGRSTKGKHKYGYIGQKGIGFKSVFKVTDCPEIHSNGFHLCFNKTCGPMGYILPHWVEDERPLDAQLKDQQSWTTKICLPLRSESHQTRNLFHDVHPSLLLFLHRLRSITIYNQSEKRLVTMTRKDLSHNVLEVEHTEGTERWLVVKTTVHPKKIKEDVESTELALAFQLNNNIAESDLVCQPEKQPVFAYLPLRSFGFRFIIQGDFDIPSSREDVDRDSSWNQWLRSEIPQLFLQAMNDFTHHPEFSGLKGLSQFLQFIPLPDEVMDFFKPVAGQIIQRLKGEAFLPTLSTDGKVVYKLPSQVAVCPDVVIRNVIGRDELEKHLSLSYLHPDLSHALPTSLLAHLGARYLRGADVTTITTAMAKELMRVEGIHSEGGLHQLARLLVCNFRALEHGYGEADSILQALRKLPIIPLADGRVVSLNGEGVFFPMEETKKKKKKAQAQAQTGPLSALYKDVNVVHPSLLNCVEPLESQQVRELLRRLGVHELEPQELLEQHIYPTIQSNKWKMKPDEVVVSYLVFIKQHSNSSQEYADTAVPVLTTRGLLCPADEKVHFSKEYGNMDLPKQLPGYDWVLLSPCYVQTDHDVAGWRELFCKLGVEDGLIIRKEKQMLTAEELASSLWSKEGSKWIQNPAEGCVIDDYPCEEFHALATAQLPGSILQQQRMALMDLLATNWDTGHHYSQYLRAQVVDRDGRPIQSTRSSFHYFLCSLEWVPAYRLLEGDQEERKCLRPNDVYLKLPEVYSLLGTHVCYVDRDSSEFSRALGMRESISVEALINYLKEWCIKPAADNQDERTEDEAEGANFISTVQHIHTVYNYLHSYCPPSSLKELFQHNPAVFIEYNRRANGWCAGRFYHLKEVCWSDPTSLFQRYKQLTHGTQEPKVLAPFYHPLEGMKAFFLRQLNVDSSPNMSQYVGLLELICESSPIPTAEVLQDVSLLYARLAQKCAVQGAGDQENIYQAKLDPSYCATLKGMVSDKRVFPTKDNTWVSLARKPMIADNKELENVFKSHKQICLLQLPPADKKAAPRSKAGNSGQLGERAKIAFNEAERSLFLEICKIRQLSDCVKTEPQTENFRPCLPMQAMVRSVVPYIQKFLYHHEEMDDVYSDLIGNNIGEKVKSLRFGQVGKLYIRYQLDIADSEDVVVEMRDVICLLKDEKELYIQKDNLSAKLEICRELVKLFCTELGHRKELMRFLSGLITSLDDPVSLKRFLNKEDVRELPGEEELWEVPEPPKPEINLDRVPSRSYSSVSSPEELSRPAQEDGEQTLACWPPRASILNTGGSRTVHADAGAVEAVMKMWPPPAAPKDRDPEKDVAARASSHTIAQSPSNSSSEGTQPPRSSRSTEQPNLQKVLHHQGLPKPAAVTTNEPRAPEQDRQSETSQSDRAQSGEESTTAPLPGPSPPSAPTAETSSDPTAPNSLDVPEAVVLSSVFQGSAATAETQRTPLNLDFPLWNAHAALEDMELNCQRPTKVVFSDDQMDVAAIGEWGEQLVNSFLCHWRDNGNDPGRPMHILWCNQSGESGTPYDFRLTFEAADGAPHKVVYVEVKSTIKKEKSFIHLSANELDFALKEKERYHIYRVYSAGDANNVRLCRIQNLAQHLHTKDLALYLFV